MMDDGAGRYFGTLYGVLALLRSKGLAVPEDMNDLVGYADLASKSIVKVSKLSREIALAAGVRPKIPDGRAFSFAHLLSKPKPSLDRLKQMHEELLEAVCDLETMGGPTAIVDKIQDEVSDHMADMDLKENKINRARFKVINGNKTGESDEGNEGEPGSPGGAGDHQGPAE